jgi:CspA family cold shock protein
LWIAASLAGDHWMKQTGQITISIKALEVFHMSEREIGTVKWFNNVRGYGFITRGEGGEDIFVHYRNIRAEGYRSLAEGQSVEFQLQQGDKGLQAEDVVLLLS